MLTDGAPIAGTVAIQTGPRLSETAISYAATRGLSQATLERLGVASGTTFFPDLNRRSDGLFFKYPDGWKARAIPDKGFVSSKGFKLNFWNIQAVIADNPSEVFITEGEIDACSLVEAGIRAGQVLSVPNGAKERPADNPRDQRGYGYVVDALKAGLSRVKRIIWCGDGDPAGLSLQADMVKLFGAARFHFVRWPEGCNDANDVLRSDGPAFLHSLVTEGRLPWPQEGLYRLSELPEPPQLTVWSLGIDEWDSRIQVAPRTISLVTGQPGHGKTMLWGQLWFQVIQRYGLVACIASFETLPRPHIRRQVRTLITGRLEMDLTEAEKAQADAWINDRYLFLSHPEERPTLDWFLDCAETAVIRHGAKIVQLDPWNRLEAMRDRHETETEYIARCLRALSVFAKQMNCHVQIVAHPAKMDGARRGKPPELEDVSGSKHWENMIDQGFVIHRPNLFDGMDRKTEAVFYHRKARFEELGYPCRVHVNYDLGAKRYVPLTMDGPEA